MMQTVDNINKCLWMTHDVNAFHLHTAKASPVCLESERQKQNKAMHHQQCFRCAALTFPTEKSSARGREHTAHKTTLKPPV